MKAVQATAPVIEPIILAELKLHLRLDSGSLADEIDTTQSIAPGAKAIANNYTTHVGTGIEVLNYQAIVNLISGTNGADGTVDCKIQESDDNVTYTDWTGGAFIQVTEANDNAIQEKAYTGTKRYIRTVAKVLVAICDFGTTVIRLTGDTVEDDLLTAIIAASRDHIENITRRALLTQTWDYYLDEFPAADFFKLPFGNLQTVTHIKYTDSAGTQTTMTVATDYIVETNGSACGRIVLPYGETWPSFTEYTSNPIVVRFVCGWTAASLIPSAIRTAVKMKCSDLYHFRGDMLTGTIVENRAVDALLASYRLWEEF